MLEFEIHEDELQGKNREIEQINTKLTELKDSIEIVKKELTQKCTSRVNELKQLRIK